MCESVENQVAWVTCDPLALGQGVRGVCALGLEQELWVAAGARLQRRGSPSPKSRAALVPVAGLSSQLPVPGRQVGSEAVEAVGSGLGSASAAVWSSMAQAGSAGSS